MANSGDPSSRGFCPAAFQKRAGLPECMRDLTPHTTPLRILSLAEVGNTASADHLLQMATMPLEHKTTAFGIPCSCPVSYHFDGADVLRQSLFSLFAVLVTGDTPRYCPLATETGMKLCIAARTDSAHIMSVALSLAAALQQGGLRWPLPVSLVRGKHDLFSTSADAVWAECPGHH